MAGTSSSLVAQFGSARTNDITDTGPQTTSLDESNARLGRDSRCHGGPIPIRASLEKPRVEPLAACGCPQVAVASNSSCLGSMLSLPTIISYVGGWATDSTNGLLVEEASSEHLIPSNRHHPDQSHQRNSIDRRVECRHPRAVPSKRDTVLSTQGISPPSSPEEPRQERTYRQKDHGNDHEPSSLASPPVDIDVEVCRTKPITTMKVTMGARSGYLSPEATPEPVASLEAETRVASTAGSSTRSGKQPVEGETHNMAKSPMRTAHCDDISHARGKGTGKKQSRQSTTDTHTGRPSKRVRHGSQCSGESSGSGEDQSPLVKQENQGGQATNSKWACPFYKADPRKHYRCLRYDLHRIKDVRQHIDRRHTNPELYCARCFQLFSTEEARDVHARGTLCTVRQPPYDFFEGVSEKQKREIFQNASRGKTPVQQWYRIWDVLNPGEDRPQSPYVGNYLEETVPLVRTICDGRREQIVADIQPTIDPSGLNPHLADYLIDCVLRQFEIGIRGTQDGPHAPAATSSQSSLSRYVPIAPRIMTPRPILGSGDEIVSEPAIMGPNSDDPAFLGLFDDPASWWLVQPEIVADELSLDILDTGGHFNWNSPGDGY